VRCIADTARRPVTGALPRNEPAPVQLRSFRPSDVPAISAIVAESLHEHYDPSLYLSLSQAWPEGFLVAEDGNGAPVGFLLGVNQVEHEGRVLMFAVERSYRARGVGTRLMQAFFDQCARRRLRRVTLEVRVSNRIAIRFYTDFAYSVTELLRGYYSDGEDGYQMARDL
jgi:ribosomal-protein-alanine N-acetyltransferase